MFRGYSVGVAAGSGQAVGPVAIGRIGPGPGVGGSPIKSPVWLSTRKTLHTSIIRTIDTGEHVLLLPEAPCNARLFSPHPRPTLVKAVEPGCVQGVSHSLARAVLNLSASAIRSPIAGSAVEMPLMDIAPMSMKTFNNALASLAKLSGGSDRYGPVGTALHRVSPTAITPVRFCDPPGAVALVLTERPAGTTPNT